jgi:hypothetical protein
VRLSLLAVWIELMSLGFDQYLQARKERQKPG